MKRKSISKLFLYMIIASLFACSPTDEDVPGTGNIPNHYSFKIKELEAKNFPALTYPCANVIYSDCGASNGIDIRNDNSTMYNILDHGKLEILLEPANKSKPVIKKELFLENMFIEGGRCKFTVFADEGKYMATISYTSRCNQCVDVTTGEQNSTAIFQSETFKVKDEVNEINLFEIFGSADKC